MKRWITGLLPVFALGACQDNTPVYVMLTYGSYASSPVVVKEVLVNGSPMAHGYVAATNADQTTPRTTDYHSLGFPIGETEGQVTVSATWVEVFTHKAWTAEVTGPVADLSRASSADTVLMGPVFGPNGLLILTSDPIPGSGGNIPTVDIAKVCGTRVPTADVDYTADTSNVWINDLLQYSYPAVTNPECPAQD